MDPAVSSQELRLGYDDYRGLAVPVQTVFGSIGVYIYMLTPPLIPTFYC